MRLINSCRESTETSIKRWNKQYETTRTDCHSLEAQYQTANTIRETTKKEWNKTHRNLVSMRESYPQIADRIKQQKRMEKDRGMER